MKLSRKTLEKAAKELPPSAYLGKAVSDGLTTKQRNFARAVAMGATKADAFRASYDATSKHTLTRHPYMLMRDERIQKEIDAYALALEAEKHRTPAALRSLVIKGLVEIALKDDTKDAVRLQALKTIGQITEVHAFTEHKETRVITSSEDARAKVMQELRGLITSSATDATVIEAEADSLLAELSGVSEPSVNFNGAPPEGNAEAQDADPPTGHPPDTAAKVPRT